MARRGGGRRPQIFSFSLPGLYPGRAALKLAGLVGLATTIYAFAPNLGPWLIIGPDTIESARIPALITNSLVALPTSALGFVFLLAIIGLFFFNQLQMLWYTERTRLIVVTVAILGSLAAIN